jgi:hypothetical protein
MYSFTAIFIYALTAELCRRCCLILIAAFTGPLSRIPGPVIGKFTLWAWIIQVIKGNQMNIAPGLFQQYGPVVRVGEDMTYAAFQTILDDTSFRPNRHPVCR